MRARAAATVAERDRMARALRAAGLGVAGLVRELPARRPRRAGGSGLEAAARAGSGRAHVRRSAPCDPHPGQPGTPADDDALLAALGAAGAGSARSARGDADRRRRAPHGRDRRPLPGRARRLRPVGRGHGDRHARPHADRALDPLPDRRRAHLHGRPVGRRAPHGRGRRDRPRPGARRRPGRPVRDRPVRRRPCPARRGAGARDRRPRRPRRDRRSSCRSPAIGSARCPGSLVPHFFDTLARSGRLGIHITGAGTDDHHVLEAAFKALARALRRSRWPRIRGGPGEVPSTKGSL